MVAAATLAVLVLAGAGLLAGSASREALQQRGIMQDAATARSGMRHAALHVNCPPGSHGVPRYAKFGQSLGHGRDAEAGRLGERSMTATVPPRAPLR